MRSSMTMLVLISALWANAQSDDLIIHGLTGNLYLEHTVVARETWYSVGRLYNVEPKALARYNHRTFSRPLEIGELLKIPLTAENFSQNGKKLASETLVPVFHDVQEKEWLYRISVNHNKVPIPVLEKWNHVTGDEVHAGLHMIVGYLKVKTALSALAKETREPRMARALMPAPESARPGEAAATNGEGANPESGKGRKPDSGVGDGGSFREEFTDGGHSVSGQAGVFKSTSGWQDRKYYALINDVPVGTIVRITDQSNGKIVYAKVLGQLPEMKESAGLTVRLSNAAAAELGEAGEKFGVGVRY